MNRYEPAVLERWVGAAFAACGVPQEHAAIAAHSIVRSELRGYKTHGVVRVASYVERLQAGDMNPRPRLAHRAFAGGLVLDADGAMGHVAGPHAVDLALRALGESASVLVAIQECGHMGALGIHALRAAEAGAFCMIGQRTPPLLAMPGFAKPALGHNPLAFACPVPNGAPIVFDMACSVAARGHMLLAAREGKSIPEGWALDDQGVPTTDPERAIRGMLLPVGGHKGIGLAMMVECLAGALAATSAALGSDRNAVPTGGAAGRQGAFLLLVRPNAFVEAPLFAQYMQHWTGTYLAAGGEHARLPGARGAQVEHELRNAGIALGDTLLRELRGVAERLRIPFPA
jgi:LDH2 family malate/lactate/ureidoglycolate dehydrogenase